MPAGMAVADVEEFLLSETNFQVFVDVEEEDSDAVKVAGHLRMGDFTSILHSADNKFPYSMATSVLDRSEDLRDVAGGRREVEDTLLSSGHLDLHEECLLGVRCGAVDFDLSSVGEASLLKSRKLA